MSRAEIISEIPRLSPADRREILRRILEVDRHSSVDLSAHGISETQASELRSRLNAFAEDWERPEADIYDQAPAR